MVSALVVLATHNPRIDLLDAQLDSLRAQTVTDWRCLVFDDSSANTDAIAAHVDGDERFTLMTSQPHLGPYAAFEHLLRNGPIDVPVFLCDQDDRWAPDKMQRLLTHIESGSDAVFSAMRVVDEDGVVLRERFLGHEPTPDSLTPAHLLVMNCVSGAALAISPRTVDAALPFPARRLRGWHDQWLAAVAARIGQVDYVSDPLVDYTTHGGQVVGLGLRSIDVQRFRDYLGRISNGRHLLPDLRSRASWVQAAAHRLLELPGPPDRDLEALAAGLHPLAGWQLWQGWRKGDVPVTRAALLAAGFALPSLHETEDRLLDS